MTPEEIIKKLEAQKKSQGLELASRVLEGAAPLITALMMFKRNKVTDWIGLGIAAINAVVLARKVRNDLNKEEDILWKTGEDGKSLFVEIPFTLRPLAMDVFRRHEQWTLDAEGIHNPEEPVQMAKVRGEVFIYQHGHVSHSTKQDFFNLPAIYMIRERSEQSMEVLREECWSQFETPNLRVTEMGIDSEIEETPKELYITDRMEDTYSHVMEFVKAGKMRSYLLEGPPGTGKTTLIHYIIKETGFRTLRIDVSQFDTRVAKAITEAIRTMVSFTRPDIVIIDDIDVLSDRSSKELLSTIEWCRDKIKIFLASANNRKRITPALLRAGRFDDFIEIKELDIKVIKSILGPELEEAAESVKKWPIVYIVDLKEKASVLGKEAALKSIEATSERIIEIQSRVLADYKKSAENIIIEEVEDYDY